MSQNNTTRSAIVKLQDHRGSVQEWSSADIGSGDLLSETTRLQYQRCVRYQSTADSDERCIVVPQGIKKIGARAFVGNNELEELVLQEGIQAIGRQACSACTSLCRAYFSRGLREIGTGAFEYCTLEQITLPEGLQRIGKNAFQACTVLPEIRIPDSVSAIGASAFDYCLALKTAVIGAGTVRIGRGAFAMGLRLNRFEVSPQNPAFCDVGGMLLSRDKTRLVCCPPVIGEEQQIPESVLRIEDLACSLSAWKEVRIPDSVTVIGARAFVECENLQKIVIGKNVAAIGAGAFINCKRLTRIEVSPENPFFCTLDGVLFTKDKSRLLCYPAGKRRTSYQIPQGVDDHCLFCVLFLHASFLYFNPGGSARNWGFRFFLVSKPVLSAATAKPDDGWRADLPRL